MTNVIAKPQVIKMPEMPAEERVKYLTDDMIYDERELAFFKIRDEVNERSIAELRESKARTEESLARGRESIARRWALIEKLKKEQSNK